MEHINAKSKPSYSIGQNIVYVLKNLWHWDKKLFLMSAARIPALVILPFLAILMPKLVLDCLSAHVSPAYLTCVVALVTLGMGLCSVLGQYLGSKLYFSIAAIRINYLYWINLKTLDIDYENLEDPEGQKKNERAIEINWNDACGSQAIVEALVTLTANSFGFVLYAGILSSLHPLVIIILLTTTAMSFLAARRAQLYEYNNKDHWTFIEKKLWYLMSKCADFASGKDIRLYGMTNWFGNLFSLLLGERITWFKRVEGRSYLSNAVDEILTLIRDGAAYAYLIYLVLAGHISVANFTLYFAAMAGFSLWASGIADQLTKINRMSLEICDIRDYLDLPDKFNRGEGVPLPEKNAWPFEVNFEHVSFIYPGSHQKVLDDFNLKIKPGEKVALVGLNGAGKTTCVKLLCGLYRPTAGRILVNGKNMLDYNRDEYFRLFTAVFQDIFVLPVSIARNIAPDIEGPLDQKRIMKCLRLAGLEEKVRSLPQGMDTPLVKEIHDDAAQLSGGELQKLLLARAIYKDSPMLILDEPTAALDPIAENELYQRYNELTLGRSSLFISHRLSSTRFCDRIVFLSDGKIIENGTHDELIRANGKYAELFTIQSHYYQDKVKEEGRDEAYGTC